jgi:hypothetical protein
MRFLILTSAMAGGLAGCKGKGGSTSPKATATVITTASAGTTVTSTATVVGTSTFTSTFTATMTNTSTSTSTTTITAKSAVIRWAPNREKAVNSSGGGYRVYYSTQNNFNPSGAAFVAVPYVSGAESRATMTATVTGLSSGTYYLKISAYSGLNAAGSTSTQISVSVP